MHSLGVKSRKIKHPILQDNYSLILILKQRRWRCSNPECRYDTSESFKFVRVIKLFACHYEHFHLFIKAFLTFFCKRAYIPHLDKYPCLRLYTPYKNASFS